jgi:hypothetical protein
MFYYTELFISPSGISEIDCATTKTDTAERSISIGREYFQVFSVLGALAFDTFRGYFLGYHHALTVCLGCISWFHPILLPILTMSK